MIFSDFHSRKRTAPTARTAVSRHIRLEGHKMHLLALLASFRHLNQLLSSPALLTIVRSYVPPATVNALNTGPEHTQARRTIAFLSGLKDLVKVWHDKWRETNRGWRRPRWVDSEDLGKVFFQSGVILMIDPCLSRLNRINLARNAARVSKIKVRDS